MSKTHIHDPRLRLLLLAVAALLLLAGCRGGDVSEMDKALAAFREMPLADRPTALRQFMGEQPDLAHYAWYEMGNTWYELASEGDVPPGVDSATGAHAYLDSALVAYGNAIAADSTFVEAWVNMGLIWDDVSEGRTPQARRAVDEAKTAYAKAIELRPEGEKARCNLGSLYYRRHEYQNAVAEFRTVLEHNPKSALAHYNLAIMFAESRMYREAKTEWELASRYDPDGDIGDRSRENLKVVDDLMNSEIPAELTSDDGH
ncbi:MAG TPA: tetratricopeptide repeat protein [Candidatus Krumholzibacteria bacterium]|nr:tetratricopeptide repeat protein [Candidatus Krumholzibacteria bacterium]